MSSIPTCPLRKPCGWCLQPYGRKLRDNGGGAMYLEAVTSWERSETCSRICSGKLLAERTKQRNESRKEENERNKEHLAAVQNMFLYPRRRLND